MVNIIRWVNKHKLLLFSILLAVFLTLFYSSSKSLDLDEVFSVFLAQKNIPEMFHAFWNYEANSWLYYILLHFWIIIGNNKLDVRYLSSLFAILTIPVIFQLGRKFFGSGVGKVAVLLLAINPFFISYAQETRGYSLLVLTSTLCTYFFMCSIKQKHNKYFLGFVVFAILSIYTHLYAGFILLAQAITLILFKRDEFFSKKLILSYIFLALLLIPLVLAPAFWGGQIFTAQALSVRDIGGIFLALAGGLPELFVIYSVVLIWAGYRFLKHKTEINLAWTHYLIIVSLLFPIAFTFLFSFFIKSIYSARYLLITLTPFILLSSVNIYQLYKYKQKVFYLTIALLLLLSSCSLYIYYSENNFIFPIWSISKGVEDWKGATDYVLSNARAGDGVTFYMYYIRQPFDYYINLNKDNSGYKDLSFFDLKAGDYLLYPDESPNISLLNGAQNRFTRVWLVLSHYRSNQLGRIQKAEFLLDNFSKKYQLVSQKTFKGDINVYLYQSI